MRWELDRLEKWAGGKFKKFSKGELHSLVPEEEESQAQYMLGANCLETPFQIYYPAIHKPAMCSCKDCLGGVILAG